MHHESLSEPLKGEPTFCPRLLLFDRKCEFTVSGEQSPRYSTLVLQQTLGLFLTYMETPKTKIQKSRPCPIGMLHSGRTETRMLISFYLLRNAGVVEYKQDTISKSSYHAQLDDVDETAGRNGQMTVGGEGSGTEPHADSSKIRYWADYTRVSFHPRSIQRLPDLPDWEVLEGDWVKGKEEFERLEEVRFIWSLSVERGFDRRHRI